MSAQLQSFSDPVLFQRMQKEDLANVIAIEKAIYQFPWTERNFSDSIDVGYIAETLRVLSGSGQADSGIIGYFVLMIALDEAHLLNLSVASTQQNQGYGRKLLRHASDLARQGGAVSMILEVRKSNLRAQEIYRRYGFEQIGMRKGYYPNSDTDRYAREDALVMRLKL